MRLIDADDLIKAFEALDLMNGQYAESFSNMAGNRSMEIGRPLRTGEIVHHIDGNKRNNEPSNLMVMTQSEHCRLHFSKKGGDE